MGVPFNGARRTGGWWDWVGWAGPVCPRAGLQGKRRAVPHPGPPAAQRGLVVEGGQCGRRVEIVVERRPDAPQAVLVGAERAGGIGRGRRRPARHPPHARTRDGPPPGRVVVGPLPVGPVVWDSSASRTTAGFPLFRRSPTKTRLPEGTWTSWSRPVPPDRRGASGARTAPRWPPRTGPSQHSCAGRPRSRPPPVTSMVSPSSRSTSAEHSMCQPGRPGPQRDSTPARRPTTAANRHDTQSGWRLFGSLRLPPSARPAGWPAWWSGRKWLTFAEAGEGGDVEVHGTAGR